MNPAITATWQLLTPVQQAEVRRMQHDPHQQYTFASTNAMLAYVLSQIGPIPPNLPNAVSALLPPAAAAPPAPPALVAIASRRQHQGPGKTLPLGLPAVSGADPVGGAYTRTGFGKYSTPTTAPRSNWSHFVGGQLVAARTALAAAPLGAMGQALFTVFEGSAQIAARELDAVHVIAPGGGLGPALALAATDATNGHLLHTLFGGLVQAESQDVQAGGSGATFMRAMLTPSRDLEVALEGIWQLVLQATRAATANPGLPREEFPVPDLPRWGPVIGDGVGTWMRARFTSAGTWAPGSSSDTGSAPMPWNQGRLNQRKKLDRTGPLYIQGHLLNDHLGGPALAYNLVPLVAAATSATNNTNMNHYYAVEGRAKAAVKEMLQTRSDTKRAFKLHMPPSPNPYDITEVWYSVVARFAGHPYRAHASGDVRSAPGLLELIKTMMAFQGQVNPGAVTIGALRVGLLAGSWGMQYSDDWTPIKPAIDAVVPLAQRATVTIDQTIARMNANAALWAYEDQMAPTDLSVALRILRANNQWDSVDLRIDNVLPTVAYQPFV
ncbi:hypothetical protein [Nakamurella lactea]|uniref:hypothetical protein n=1 Tax=Nakamurella lactea TaxID=459515 RepID=UPI0004013BD1|nr:hypothetical protein [Nakamurella lactea]